MKTWKQRIEQNIVEGLTFRGSEAASRNEF